MKKRWLLLFAAVVLVAAALLYARQLLLPHITAWPSLGGDLRTDSLSHEGRERHYQLYRPATLVAKPALLLVFHGSQSDGAAMRALGAHQFDRLADDKGFLLVYPDGYERHWNDCRGTASYAANTENIDDVGFVRALVSKLAGDFGVDTSAVYATGLSNGGHMALRLALEAPDLVAAVAPMASNLPADTYMDCEPSGEPVNIAFVAGTHDPINPYEGGLVKILWDESRGMVQSAPESAAYFAGLAGYDTAAEQARLDDTEYEDDSWIRSEHWRGRDQRVALYTLVGGGHIFPSRNTHFGKLLGGDNRDLDAADLIWTFFIDSE